MQENNGTVATTTLAHWCLWCFFLFCFLVVSCYVREAGERLKVCVMCVKVCPCAAPVRGWVRYSNAGRALRVQRWGSQGKKPECVEATHENGDRGGSRSRLICTWVDVRRSRHQPKHRRPMQMGIKMILGTPTHILKRNKNVRIAPSHLSWREKKSLQRHTLAPKKRQAC